MLVKGKANILIDGQFGSTGKGLLAGYVANNSKVRAEYAVTNAAPNAGHTFYREDGLKIVAKHLPMYGILDKESIIYLDAGAVIHPQMLIEEIVQYDVEIDRVRIHPRAAVIYDEDIEKEKNRQSPTTQLASTQSGVGAAIARKINRHDKAIAGNHPILMDMCQTIDLNTRMEDGETVLVETPQGVGLGINDGYQYPYCTSRNVSISQSLADANIHPFNMGATFLSMRTFPIRVGNLKDENGKQIGYSGDFYPDCEEKSFKELNQEDEYTTVTKRVRRVATFSFKQYKEVCQSCKPDFVFMNFVNYIESHEEVIELLETCESIYAPKMWMLGYGERAEDVKLARPITTRR